MTAAYETNSRFRQLQNELRDLDIDDKQRAIEILSELYGETWTTDELTRDFTVEGFCAGHVVCTRKSDGQRGSLEFKHMPRVYHSWRDA